MAPSNTSSAASDVLRAPLPTLTPEFVAEHYPSQLRLVHVDLLHRHGERTPVSHRIPEISPKYWNICAKGNPLHRDFLKAIGRDTESAGGDSTDGGVQWQSHIFKNATRSS
ncbi:hypothetical protein IWW49_002863, partial [Coemansia sp. RSA 1797]